MSERINNHKVLLNRGDENRVGKGVTYVECPNFIDPEIMRRKRSVFLAGGISECPDWQSEMVELLKGTDIILFNPRRRNFPIDDPNAAEEQINWEDHYLFHADSILYWFCEETLQPIVMNEHGQYARTLKPIFVGIHPNYQRRLDIELRTKRPDVKIVYNLQDLAEQVIAYHIPIADVPGLSDEAKTHLASSNLPAGEWAQFITINNGFIAGMNQELLGELKVNLASIGLL
jgi:hypothetical protein